MSKKGYTVRLPNVYDAGYSRWNVRFVTKRGINRLCRRFDMDNDDGGVQGLMDIEGRKIYVRNDLDFWDTIETVIHETLHAVLGEAFTEEITTMTGKALAEGTMKAVMAWDQKRRKKSSTHKPKHNNKLHSSKHFHPKKDETLPRFSALNIVRGQETYPHR